MNAVSTEPDEGETGAGDSMDRRLWQLALPIMLANISVPLLGAVDTAVMGHLGAPYYIGAIAIGGMIFSVIFWGFGFLRMSTGGLTAQAFGRGDSAEVVASFKRAAALALLLALVVLLLQRPVAGLLLLVDASDAVVREAATYFYLRIWSAPATLLNFVITGWLLGLQRTRLTLLLTLFGNGLNVVLDLVLVVVFGMATAGVALATVVAEYCTLGLGLVCVLMEMKRFGGVGETGTLFAREAIRRLLGVNRDIFIRTFGLIGSFAYLTLLGARQGDLILAVNALLLNFSAFTAYGLDGLAHACESLTGRAIGAGNDAQLSRVVRATFRWSFLLALGVGGIYLLGGHLILGLLTDLPDVRAAARIYLPWAVISPLISVWCYVLDGIFIGATLAREMRNAMLVSVVLFGLIAEPFLGQWGNHGLWLAFMLFMAVRGLSLGLIYARVRPRLVVISSQPATDRP
ncbi:MAG: MATE family efflux transporter [Gammaproteobacteria bacterium]|nr:MATE family efflux transporter [Gammaproteobacteria bacterium]